MKMLQKVTKAFLRSAQPSVMMSKVNIDRELILFQHTSQ